MAAVSLLLLTVGGLVLLTKGLPWVPLATFGCLGGVLVTGRRAAVAGAQRPAATKPEPIAAEPGRADQETSEVSKAEPAVTQSAKPSARPLTKAQLLKLPSRTAGARRPGISGRIVAGQTDFQLPEPLVIAEVELGSVFSSGDNATATEPIPVAVDVSGAVEAVVETPPAATTDKTNWTPTPVPPPSYTLSGAAARWEPRELTEVDYAQASQAALRLTEQATEQARQAGVTHPETSSRGLPVRRIFSDKGIDLNKALDRRRTANS